MRKLCSTVVILVSFAVALTSALPTPTQAGPILKGVGKNMTLVDPARRKRARSLCWDDWCERCCTGFDGKTRCRPICI
jgi:hypothetical protein